MYLFDMCHPLVNVWTKYCEPEYICSLLYGVLIR